MNKGTADKDKGVDPRLPPELAAIGAVDLGPTNHYKNEGATQLFSFEIRYSRLFIYGPFLGLLFP